MYQMTTRKKPPTLRDLEQTVIQAQQALEEAKARLAELAQQPKDSLIDRIGATLRAATLEHPMRTMTFDEIVASVGAPAGPVSKVMKQLHLEGEVYNMGTDDRPQWIWVVGDSIPTDQLLLLVPYMLSFKPMGSAELVQATKVNRNRISNAITQVRSRLVNYGTDRKALWFLPGGLARNS